MVPTVEEPDRNPSNGFQLHFVVIEVTLVVFLFWLFLGIGGGSATPDAMILRPHPDLLEQVHMAHALANGHSLLIPLSNELHPPRYSLAHAIPLSLWMAVSGRGVDAYLTYPTLAFAGIFLMMVLGLAALRVGMIFRIFALVMFNFSPLILNASRDCLQETTLLFLLASGLAAWFWSLRLQSHRLELPLCFLAGVLLSLMACTRPTEGTILLLIGLFEFILVRRRGWMRVAMGVGGILLAVLLISLVNWILCGVFHVFAYSHWQPDMEFFSRKYFWLPPVNFPDGKPVYLMIWEAVVETAPSSRLFVLTPVALLGVLISIVSASLIPGCLSPGNPEHFDRCIVRMIPVLLFLALFLETLILCFYFFHTRRFLVGPWLMFVLAAALALHLLSLKVSKKTGRVIGCCIVLAGLLMLESHKWFPVLDEHANECKAAEGWQTYFLIDRIVHKKNAPILQQVRGPIFCEMPVVQIRIDADLARFPHPIGWIALPPDGWADSHFFFPPPTKPHGYLEPREHWPPTSKDLFLQSHDGTFKRDVVDLVLEHHSEFALYFPHWMEHWINGTLGELEAMGLVWEDRSTNKSWRLHVYQRLDASLIGPEGRLHLVPNP